MPNVDYPYELSSFEFADYHEIPFLSFPLWKDKFKWYVAVTRDNDVDNLIELKETLRG